MTLNNDDLALKIHNDMGFTGAVSNQLKGWAKAVIDELINNGMVNNASGTITGTCPSSGGPLQNGTSSNGIISGLNATNLASAIVNNAGYGYLTPQVTDFSTEIVNHLMSGLVAFSSGNITGTCTNTLTNPGTLINGTGSNGTISGLNGTTLATAIHNMVFSMHAGPTPKLIQFCTAFTDYIMTNAIITYSSGNVTGSCSSGGGPLSGGMGVNGTIS